MEKEAIKTFNQLAVSYLAEPDQKEKSPVTLHAHKRYLQNNVSPVIGRKKVSSITTEDVEEVLEFMREKALSEGTIKTVYGVARRVCAYGVQIGVMKENPFLLVDPGFRDEKKGMELSLEQLENLQEAFGNTPFGNFFGVILECGISRSETLGMKWEDIDWDERVMHIRREYIDEVGNLILRPCKREKTIPINRACEQYLLQERGAQKARKTLAGDQWNEGEGFVFTDASGYLLRPDRVSIEMNELNKQLQIPGLNLRNLKNYYLQKYGM